MSVTTQENVLGSLVSYSVSSLKIKGTEIEGSYCSRSAFLNSVVGVAGREGFDKFVPYNRKKRDAIKVLFRKELDRMAIPLNGWILKPITKKAGDVYHIDLQIVDDQGKEVNYVKYARITFSTTNNKDGEFIIDVADDFETRTSYTIPQELTDFLNSFDRKINWLCNQLIDDDLRKICYNLFESLCTINVRSGIMFIRSGRMEKVRELNRIFEQIIPSGEVRFTIYNIGDDPENRESLTRDIMDVMDTEAESIQTRVQRVEQLNEQLSQTVQDSAPSREIQAEILEEGRHMERSLTRLQEQAQEVVDLIPDAIEVIQPIVEEVRRSRRIRINTEGVIQ